VADDITIDLGMDPSTYLAGAQQITGANSQLQQSFGGLTAQTTMVQRAIDAVTPKRATLLAWGGMAASAANTQQALSGVAAQATVTHANTTRLANGMRQLARDFPIGNAAARQTVEQITKMGVATEGSEARVLKLSKSVVQLSGATGEGLGGLTSGMVELARASGNTNLDPKRFERLGDALTTVSAKSGASATNVLAFSKNIAPMAQAAGIGATGILGISSAFAKMGEDGVGASTAVNKMLSDMSRSVRDGTPEMAAYAQIVGKTSDEFEKLFKNNPTEALTQVTEALAKNPQAAPRQLEMLGLDGPRTSRYLTALAAQGGIRTTVAQAAEGFGSGSTQKAAEAAFGGLNDSVNKLTSSSQQLAEAFGAPLLRPLTAFTDLLGKTTSLLGSVVSSKPAQGALSALAYGGIGIMGARALLGPLSALGLTRQALTSTPLRALAAGYSQGRGLGQGSFLRRFGAPSQNAADEGRLGTIGARFLQYGRGLGNGMGPAAPGTGTYSLGDRLRMARGGVASLADMNLRMISGSLFNGAQNDPSLRRQVGAGTIATPWRGFGNELRGIWSARYANPMSSLPGASATAQAQAALFRQGNQFAAAQFARGPVGGLNLPKTGDPLGFKGVGSAAESLQKRLLAAGDGASMFRRLALSAAQVPLGMGAMGMRAAGDVANVGMRAGGALLSSVGGAAGLGVMGILGLGMAARNSSQSRKDTADELANRNISETLDAYRDSIGKATGPAITHGSMTDTLGKNIAAATSSITQALNVTADDLTVAQGSLSKVVHHYQGTAEQQASQIKATAPNGMTPDELQAVKVDLLRQNPNNSSFVQDVLNKVGPSINAAGVGQAPVGAAEGDFRNIMQAAGKADPRGGFLSGLVAPFNSNSMSDYNASHRGPGWLDAILGSTSAGGALYRSHLSDDTKKQIDNAVDSQSKRFLSQSTTYGTDYAQQERIKSANAMLEEAKKTGNAEVFDKVARSLTQDLSGKQGGYQMTGRDFDKAGGDIGAFLSKQDKDYAKGYQDLEAKRKAAGGNIEANEIQSAVSKNLEPVSAMMSQFFDARRGGAANQAVASSLAQPGNVQALDKAAGAMVTHAQQTGASMAQLGGEAVKAANNLSEASQEFAIVKAAQARAEFTMARQQIGMSPADAMAQQYAYQTTLATQDAKNPTQAAEKRQAQQNLLGMDQANAERLKARLQAQREYEISASRAQQDFDRQRLYATQDFSKQETRIVQDANLSKARAQEDYHKQVSRAEEDFNTARGRQLRDFNTSMERAEQDALKTRARAIRDFNIGLQRQIEDAAKSLYDPYDRIQTKATWDAKNLMVNLREQNAALEKQKAQLDQLRKMGLSAQAIDQLQLGKAENAQQVNNLVADFGSDPSQIAQLNKIAAQRGKDAGALVTDASNTDLKRAKEDLAKSLGDMSTDLRTNLGRARADLAKSLRDQSDDFARSMRRGATDFATSLARNEADLSRNLGRMETDQATSLARQQAGLQTGLDRMSEDIKRADETISGSMADLNKAVMKAMAGQTGAYQSLVTNDTKKFVSQMQTEVIPAMKRVAGELGIDLPTASDRPASAYGGQSTKGGQLKAEGGTIDGFSPHAKADNIPVWATAGEFMQPVDTVNHYGVNAMEAIRKKRIPKELIAGFADGGLIEFGKLLRKKGYAVSEHPMFGGVHPVHAPGSEHYNKRGPGGGGAIDVNADPFNSPFKNEKNAINAIIGLAGQYGLRTIWQSAGHYDHAHFDISNRGNMVGAAVQKFLSSAGGAGGGFDVASVMKSIDPKKGGWYGQLRDMVAKQLEEVYGGGGGSSTAAYTGKGGAKQWQGTVVEVLHMLGRSTGELGAVLRRIDLESGGNPKAINLWDVNAKNGVPSKGLMQVIDPTFRAYRSKTLPDDIWNPKANIYAGANYAIKRYGSLAAIDPRIKPTGYDSGGDLPPGLQMVYNATGKPEKVLTDQQWAGVTKLSQMAGTVLSAEQGRTLSSGKAVHMTVHNNQRITYDQRNDFGDARITVVSQDPDEMGRKLETKATRQRLTQTRGVRRNGG